MARFHRLLALVDQKGVRKNRNGMGQRWQESRHSSLAHREVQGQKSPALGPPTRLLCLAREENYLRYLDLQVAKWPGEDNGKFYSGDSYIILNTYKTPPSDVRAMASPISFRDEGVLCFLS